MFVDAREIPNGTRLKADVCIVGAGAAGITVARELASSTLRIAVLESGFLDTDPATQALYDGETRGVPYFPLGDGRTRIRRFGGSTGQWAGECRPLDALDFRARDWVPASGWPFDRDHLHPYYERAQEVCQLGRGRYRAEDWPARHAPPQAPNDRITPVVIQYSPPTRFGEVYRDDLRRSPTTTVYLGANVVDLVTPDNPVVVGAAEVACIDGPRFSVEARAFVLATGGIENARLLLSARQVHPRGLGNDHDLVGRYFMEHLYLDAAATISATPRFARAYAVDQRAEGRRVRFALGLSEQAQRDEELTSFTAVVSPSPVTGARFGRVWRAFGSSSRLHPRQRPVRLHVKNVMEQAPNPESRVTLGRERDALGSPKAVLDWRTSALDRHTAHRAHCILDEELRSTGLGLVVDSRCDGSSTWPPGLRGARHHMGTTRMHADPRQGVVDADCRVHATTNLFVGGSSVFPTSGSANPTLTIVALAARLAAHLRRALCG